MIAFHSSKFIVVEINYDVHDKEFMVIVNSIEQWRHFWNQVIDDESTSNNLPQ